ncbi:MAG: ADP-ribosylglycohydrolase family protein [Paludibacteraceae bacterium]|nr:ADP-ribosylglycohydrolase family protein [Paludibacteraceae bacterium]
MLGAIIGDMAGSIYEFDNIKTTDFELLSKDCEFTDDSVLSVAVADWLLSDKENLSHKVLEEKLLAYAKKYKYPMGGYGGGFLNWAFSPERLYDYGSKSANGRKPYNSWGNGSAMRCSAVGWMFDTLEDTERAAEISANITHNHPEGVKGAQATAAAIFMARTGKTKDEITDYIEEKYGYDLQRTCDDIRPTYDFEGSCQKTVPEAIIAFLDSTDFESAIRLAVSLGGDSDTLTCITGGIAEAFYKSIPTDLAEKALDKLPDEFKSILEQLRKNSNYIQTY